MFTKKGNLRQYQSIPDNKVESLFSKGYEAKPVLVKAGTVLLIDTAKLIICIGKFALFLLASGSCFP